MLKPIIGCGSLAIVCLFTLACGSGQSSPPAFVATLPQSDSARVVTGLPPTTLPSRTPTYTPTATHTATVTPTGTPSSTATLTASALPTASATLTPTPEMFVDHYSLNRPIAPQGSDTIDRTYPYGDTQNGRRRPHHGVEFVNPRGAPVLAAGSGVVVYAGEDSDVQIGPQLDFYGNVVIVNHGFTTPGGLTVYSLYAHLDRIAVALDQRVAPGDRIGIVGDTGIAEGPHLHFEVRRGDPFDYGATSNPDLWLFPKPGTGALAGRVTDADGDLLSGAEIQIRRTVDNPILFYGYSYSGGGVNSAVAWDENFTRGDLRAGEYEVFVSASNGRILFSEIVMIENARTTWVSIELP